MPYSAPLIPLILAKKTGIGITISGKRERKKKRK
jgi:hypothetical protein